jgi:hypothetical protein
MTMESRYRQLCELRLNVAWLRVKRRGIRPRKAG